MTIEESGAIMLTPFEFSERTRIPLSNRIFDDMPDDSKFWMYPAVKNRMVNTPERFFFNNGKVILEFKHMKEYGETWMRVFDMTQEKPQWSLWDTWKVWD